MPDFLQSSAQTGFSCPHHQEDLLVFICEGKVGSLGGEVSDDTGQVTAPEGQDSLLLGDVTRAVCNALVSLICGDWLAGMLRLQQQPDPLYGGDRCLGDGCGHSTCQEVLGKDTAASVMLKGKQERETAGLGS